ncbi:protein WHAT'S THIS FACTOR 1 [Tanacetum coccineum]
MKIQNRKVVKYIYVLTRRFSLWSMKKDPDLEAALTRNRRWVVNNQIKNIILRCPDQVASVSFLQKKFKSLDLQGKALNWLKKYPCCFETYLEKDECYCRLTKRMMFLVEEEENIKDMQEPVVVERLAKLLMMVANHRLNVSKLNEVGRSLGLPDDYLIRIIPKYLDMFQVINYSGRKSSMEIELIKWDQDLAVSAIEKIAQKKGVKSWEKFREFDSSPYISPYTDPDRLVDGSREVEKRTIGLLHEFLSLTLWKKASIMKLGHFRREFGLPDKLNVLLLKHPGIFYVTNKYQIYTVLLREGYKGPELVDKDPLVAVKDKFGELMQEGLHEYNRRHHIFNLEKRRKKGMIAMKEAKKDPIHELSDDEVGRGDNLGGIF